MQRWNGQHGDQTICIKLWEYQKLIRKGAFCHESPRFDGCDKKFRVLGWFAKFGKKFQRCFPFGFYESDAWTSHCMNFSWIYPFPHEWYPCLLTSNSCQWHNLFSISTQRIFSAVSDVRALKALFRHKADGYYIKAHLLFTMTCFRLSWDIWLESRPHCAIFWITLEKKNEMASTSFIHARATPAENENESKCVPCVPRVLHFCQNQQNIFRP